MEISNQLLKPLIDRLCEEYQGLDSELKLHPDSEEINDLKGTIQKKIQQLENLDTVLLKTPAAERLTQSDLRDTLRQLKLELRFTQRRWKRQLLNEVRFKRSRRKDTLAAA
jgi:hypothetical protein